MVGRELGTWINSGQQSETEHLTGGEYRLVPMFPERSPYLEQSSEQAAPGSKSVITRYRDADKNLRTQLHPIICWAGLKPWPHVSQNLRSTRETELQNNSRSMWSASGSATLSRWLRSIIFKRPTSILNGHRRRESQLNQRRIARHEIRHGTCRNCR